MKQYGNNIYSCLNYELCISTSWNDIDNIHAPEHGICGHTFEMIEYFWLLKDSMSCCLLWTENITRATLIQAIVTKYNFNDEELSTILKHSIFIYKPKLLRVNKILLVDGEINRNRHSKIIYNAMFLFACGNRDLHRIHDDRILVLQDRRIYKDGSNVINYTKKLLLDRYKVPENPKRCSFLYLTDNCRFMDIDEVRYCIYYFNNMFGDIVNRSWLIGVNNEDSIEYYKELQNEYNLEIKVLPIIDFHEQFDHYVYTPTPRKFDCSNRLIVECVHFDKLISYYKIDDDYLKQDLGLKYRREDMLTTNKFNTVIQTDLKKLNLIENEEDNQRLINILKGN